MSYIKRYLETQEERTPAEKLERACARLRLALRAVASTEGRTLDFDTAEEITRSLSAAARDLEELSVSLAVMERGTR